MLDQLPFLAPLLAQTDGGFLHNVLHVDKALGGLIQQYGFWTYGILCLILFCETGLVVTPFLPGDTLLFASGIFSHATPDRPYGLNVYLVLVLFSIAPVLGDLVNYTIGRTVGQRLVASGRLLKPSHLEKTHSFFERHGPKTVMLARWVPIVRTFAPFVAGMGGMEFRTFFRFSVLGALVWVWVCVGAGYLLGGIPWVKDNFSVAMLLIVAVTVLPILFELVKARRHRLAADRA